MSKNRPFFAISGILISLLLCTLAQNNNSTLSCPSSSCGSITEIRFPFRLNSDPVPCGHTHPIFHLHCQNNQTVLTTHSKRYLVRGINYNQFSIRLVDPSINRVNLSSCPAYYNDYDDWPNAVFDNFFQWNVPVVFVYCLEPVIDNRNYIEAPFCGNRSSIFSNSTEVYSYVMVGGNILVSDLEESCSVGRVARASSRGPTMDNRSLAGVYEGVGYGFELSWFRVLCGECERTFGYCSLEGNRITCRHYCREDTPLSQLGFRCE